MNTAINGINKELIKEVRLLLIEKGWTQRELFFALREAGLKISETKLSNRLNGINGFTDEEIKVINKLFKSKLKVA